VEERFMNKAKWRDSTDPMEMLRLLVGRDGERKLRLFAVACCRRIWPLFTDERCRVAVEVAERAVEGAATPEELAAAEAGALAAAEESPRGRTRDVTAGRRHARLAALCVLPPVPGRERPANSPDNAAVRMVVHCPHAFRSGPADDAREKVAAELAAQAALLRCIFGNPFRKPPPLPPAVLAWQASTARRIAEGIYEERAFDRLPILADALLDAGCDDEELIAHCREPGPHVRGCWAVDLILGKS
jgi:hypothetical protein